METLLLIEAAPVYWAEQILGRPADKKFDPNRAMERGLSAHCKRHSSLRKTVYSCGSENGERSVRPLATGSSVLVLS
jgi:hypothetical protein